MQKEEYIFRLIREINNRLCAKMNQIYAPYGLTNIQLEILMELYLEHPLTMSTLANRLAMSNSNLSAIIKRLETHGFVSRQRDPHNQRTVQVMLCENGKNILEELRHTGCKKRMLYDISSQDMIDMVKGLEKLNQILKECEEDE